MSARPQIFISYSGGDAFEAGLLQYALESLLSEEGVIAWTFQRDQNRTEKEIAKSLKNRISQSIATLLLISPATLDDGATQWMELAYSDAFNVPTFVLLHHIDHQALRQRERGVPPLLLASQCTPASSWKAVVEDVRRLVKSKEQNHE